MKKLMFLLFFIPLISMSQNTFHPIVIDGSVSYKEIVDTTAYKTKTLNANIIIKESPKNYYIGIRSNSGVVANLYLKQSSGFKILHGSFSLGDTHYFKNNNSYRSIDSSYHWAFKDPIMRETKPSFDELQKELLQFYKHHQWVGTTSPMGSMREAEFIISKQLLKNIDDLVISYYAKEDNKRVYHYYPKTIKSFSESSEIDKQLMNGYLPQVKQIHFKN